MISNDLLDTIGSVDERHIRDDELAAVGGSGKRRPSKKIALLIASVAAAAVGLSIIVGFSMKTDYKNEVVIGNEAIMPLDLRVRELDIPEKYYNDDGERRYVDNAVQMSMSELADEFGLEILGVNNERFSEEIDFEPNRVWNGKGELIWIYYGEPQLAVHDSSVEIRYYLHSESLGRDICFNMECINDDICSWTDNVNVYDGMLYEIIKLNDGSNCYVDKNNAIFSYDGIYYSIGITNYTNEERAESLDDMMQILKDLGVLN